MPIMKGPGKDGSVVHVMPSQVDNMKQRGYTVAETSEQAPARTATDEQRGKEK